MYAAADKTSEPCFIRRLILWLALVAGVAFVCLLPGAHAASVPQAPSAPPLAAPVVVIPVDRTIESGLERFMQRAFAEAQELGAMHIILDIDTLGGSVESAEHIGQLVKESPIPTIAYVRGKAISAGAYIALNANRIAMEPGSSMGAAAVVDGTGSEIENVKVVSYWSGQMKAAAELRGRNTQVAEAMVDKQVGLSLPELGREVPKGQILTLTAGEAVKVGYAETMAADVQEVVRFIGGADHPLVTIEASAAEQVARFVTLPWVSVLLLLIGIAGIAIEMLVAGFGIAGVLGILGFGLYFFGHYIAGFAGVEDVALFIAGIFLLILEIFVSSFGILGFLGAVCLFSGVVLSAYNMKLAALNLGIAFLGAVVVVAIVVKIFQHRGVWNRFILRDKLTTEEGYVSVVTRRELVGKTGTSVTPLRPAGTAVFDEERLDVVADGEFIPANRTVTITFVEGSRIVVKEVKQ
ncbi:MULTISPECIES: NfeD family protein [Paenibacillus]|uniref:Nodulation protein NfeD n=1 Tax=Paenibacillus validus TaxID=44253 RepID=A0A7X3CUW0_9BACL|nr:nodulation protein NfeD [Paenibacillus validus]MUG72537.1 nodulation protein NfeD [Paenibacillus validus]